MKKYFKNGSKEDDVADDNISIKLFPQTFARMKEGNKNQGKSNAAARACKKRKFTNLTSTSGRFDCKVTTDPNSKK